MSRRKFLRALGIICMMVEVIDYRLTSPAFRPYWLAVSGMSLAAGVIAIPLYDTFSVIGPTTNYYPAAIALVTALAGCMMGLSARSYVPQGERSR